MWMGVAACAMVLAPIAAGPTLARPQQALRLGFTADRVVVLKRERWLYLLKDGDIKRAYRVALGRQASGAKTRQGDGRTPEGSYTLDYRNPRSKFHKAIHVSYPDARDRAQAKADGVSPGGNIMIHGLPNRRTADEVNHPVLDWTEGSIAVNNREINEIWAAVPNGTPIVIYP